MKPYVVNVILGILFAALIFIAGYNIVKGNEEFLNATLIQIMTLMVALGITFWANQFKTDQRKKKEHAEELIIKLQALVTDETFCCFSTSSNVDEITKSTGIRNRKISNYIQILLAYDINAEFKTNIQYILGQFEDYRLKIGDHITDIEYLAKTEADFRRIAENIDTKIGRAHV